jgi:hypothetical protein
MVLRLDQQPSIENLRNYPAAIVDQLRQLLAAGVQAHPDPRRANFYELENHSQVFYIHISPANGKVWLLATWQKEEKPATTPAAHEVA